MAIPTDLRQFHLKHLLWMTLSLSLPLSLFLRFPVVGVPLLIGVASFWIGVGFLFISDLIDIRPIDERGWISYLFNLFGIFIVAFSLIGNMFFILFVAAILFMHFFH